MDHYDFPISPNTDQTTHTIHKNVDVTSANDNKVVPGVEDSGEKRTTEEDVTNKYINSLNTGKEKDKSVGVSMATSPWKVKRILLTYFLPIIISWFGCICTDLL